MKVDVFGIQGKALRNLTVKVYCNDEELAEVSKDGKITVDVPEGSLLKFKLKKQEAVCDVIGTSVVLSLDHHANLLLAFPTNNPDRIIQWLNREAKKNRLLHLLDALFG